MLPQEQEDASRQRPTKAVIFTHFGSLQYGPDDESFRQRENEYLEFYTRIIRSYLECNLASNRLGIVYAYVDWALRSAVPKIASNVTADGGSFNLNARLAQNENALVGLLRRAERKARRELQLDPGHPPRFHFVGILQLVGLLNSIVRVDPELAGFLCGPGGRFTYDSPKFVEAVIRLARGHTAHLALDPVVRIDEDAQITGETIDKLLEAYVERIDVAPFYFFSGAYGTTGGHYDPLNDHAVRVHWFFPVGFRSGDPIPEEALRASTCFLASLSELGATQIPNSSDHYSTGLKELLTSGRPANAPDRPSPQVISGAGLIMSSVAVNVLPPFMNFEFLTTWVDDFLKRRLHEAVGDLGANDLESVFDAKVKQDRHPNGVTQTDMQWASTTYFDRVLRGCIFRRLITDLQGRPSDYSTLISDIVCYRVGNGDRKIGKVALAALQRDMMREANERYEDVIRCWKSREFRGFPLFNWAKSRSPAHRRRACYETVHDAVRYIHLLIKWHIFVRAIERLPFPENDWLFESVDEVG